MYLTVADFSRFSRQPILWIFKIRIPFNCGIELFFQFLQFKHTHSPNDLVIFCVVVGWFSFDLFCFVLCAFVCMRVYIYYLIASIDWFLCVYFGYILASEILHSQTFHSIDTKQRVKTREKKKLNKTFVRSANDDIKQILLVGNCTAVKNGV